jgi:hypothetical protein
MTDFKSLDAKALVARLALVKERVVEDAAVIGDPYDPTEVSTAKTPAQLAAELADTLSVLDECASRLLRPKTAVPSEQGAVGDLDRLRGLVRTLLAYWEKRGGSRCAACGMNATHEEGCPVAPLVAEAGKR